MATAVRGAIKITNYYIKLLKDYSKLEAKHQLIQAMNYSDKSERLTNRTKVAAWVETCETGQGIRRVCIPDRRLNPTS